MGEAIDTTLKNLRDKQLRRLCRSSGQHSTNYCPYFGRRLIQDVYATLD